MDVISRIRYRLRHGLMTKSLLGRLRKVGIGIRPYILYREWLPDAAEWTDRGARSPGAHALIAMIAAAAHVLAGDTQRAQYWAGEARKINPALTRTEFFGAFPMRSPALHRALNTALKSLGF